ISLSSRGNPKDLGPTGIRDPSDYLGMTMAGIESLTLPVATPCAAPVVAPAARRDRQPSAGTSTSSRSRPSNPSARPPAASAPPVPPHRWYPPPPALP